MAEWRSILARLSCFLRTADYIILDMLHRLVKTAVRTLLEFLVTSTHTGEELARKELSDSEEDDDFDSDDEDFIPKKKTGGEIVVLSQEWYHLGLHISYHGMISLI